MKRAILLLLVTGLSAQYPGVFLSSTGHQNGGKVYNATTAFPDLSALTWIQQTGTTSLTQSLSKPPVFWFQNPGTEQIPGILGRSIGAPPYTVTMCGTTTAASGAYQTSFGLFLRKSSTDQGILFPFEQETSITGDPNRPWVIAAVYQPLVSATGLETQPGRVALFVRTTVIGSNRTCLRIADDGVNRTYYSCAEGGNALRCPLSKSAALWNQEFQEASGATFAPDQAGIYGYTVQTAVQLPGLYGTLWYFKID